MCEIPESTIQEPRTTGAGFLCFRTSGLPDFRTFTEVQEVDQSRHPKHR
jgi:hypothetical protein